jgi:hypothetical protein
MDRQDEGGAPERRPPQKTLSDQQLDYTTAGSVPQGQRNMHLASMAGSMRRPGMSIQAIEAALLAENVKRCHPPLPEDEVRQIACSIGRYAPEIDAKPNGHEHIKPPIKAGHRRNVTAAWPGPLSKDAYHGLAGKIVRLIEPHSEADPAAILVQLLTAFGSIIGRGPHWMVEGDLHTTNLFTVMVGDTSKGRKGTSWGRVRQLFALLDDGWVDQCIQSGLSSGEGLIWAVRDPVDKQGKRGKGDNFGLEGVMEDAGIDDKRMLVIEPELASILRVLSREGNTISPVIRQAWDQGNLRSMTKNSPACATGALISVIGHVTADELRRYLNRTEAGNGFANRFLFVCVRRSKCLPEGGHLELEELAPYAKRLADAIDHARKQGRMVMDGQARGIWHAVYPELSEGLPGLLGSVTSRAEAQVMRLALLYALLDTSVVINAEHLNAARAVWKYAEASARYIFGSAVGDPIADDILRSLRANPDGLSRTEISNLFRRNRDAQTLGRALESLQHANLARPEQQQTEGRPVEVWRAC